MTELEAFDREAALEKILAEKLLTEMAMLGAERDSYRLLSLAALDENSRLRKREEQWRQRCRTLIEALRRVRSQSR